MCAGDASGSECGSAVNLNEMLAEIRQLRVQLERSIQTNTTLRQRLEQQLLSRSDPKSTININYLLTNTGTNTHISNFPSVPAQPLAEYY